LAATTFCPRNPIGLNCQTENAIMKLGVSILSLLLSSCFTFAQQKSDSLKIITVAESSAEFPGGNDAFLVYIKNHLRYPKEAKNEGIKGIVLLAFTIGPAGDVLPESVSVIRSLNSLCDIEAMRVIKKSPKWKPGKQYGKGVPVKYTVQVKFE
jgi:TonB family protein